MSQQLDPALIMQTATAFWASGANRHSLAYGAAMAESFSTERDPDCFRWQSTRAMRFLPAFPSSFSKETILQSGAPALHPMAGASRYSSLCPRRR